MGFCPGRGVPFLGHAPSLRLEAAYLGTHEPFVFLFGGFDTSRSFQSVHVGHRRARH